MRGTECLVRRPFRPGREQHRRGLVPRARVRRTSNCPLGRHNDRSGVSFNRYSVFRRVVDYYNDDPTGRKAGEDAFDMRKPLSRDKKLKHIRKNGENFRVEPEDLYH